MPRPMNDAASRTQLQDLNAKIAKKPIGTARLAMLREQAALGDQRDIAEKNARRNEAY